MKRSFDFVLSFLGLVCLGPLLLLVAILIVLEDRGPVFFRQVRVGQYGRTFRIHKFRTMVVDAEKKGLQITVGGRDPRVTRIGYYLRKFKLDELPQLLDVLQGTMSFVGPRPEVPKYVAYYNIEQQLVLQLKPGITDLASIIYKDENALLGASNDPEHTYIHEVMPAKLKLNALYIGRQSIIYDLKIIYWTLLAIIGGKIPVDIK